MTKTLLCITCGQPFTVPKQRGRPRKWCDSCKGAPVPSSRADNSLSQLTGIVPQLNPTERIDRLELMLKSAGLHLSQQQAAY